MRIACVIVTFNRLELLKKAVQAVTGQSLAPMALIVVDNDSCDGTKAWLDQLSRLREDTFVLTLDKNRGGAAGFHYGIKKACTLMADWIWTLDDDCLPAPDALEKLVRCGIIGKGEEDRRIGFLSSQVNWKDGSRHRMNVPGPAVDWTSNDNRCQGSVKLRYSSFVSLLINRVAVEAVGLPLKEFFIYCDDVEFTRRITDSGFLSYYIETSKVIHMTEKNAGITMERIIANPPQLGNREYIVRNLIAVNRQERFGVFKETGRLLYLWVNLVANKTSLPVQVALIRAGLAGLFLNYRKWIQYPSDERIR